MKFLILNNEKKKTFKLSPDFNPISATVLPFLEYSIISLLLGYF